MIADAVMLRILVRINAMLTSFYPNPVYTDVVLFSFWFICVYGAVL